MFSRCSTGKPEYHGRSAKLFQNVGNVYRFSGDAIEGSRCSIYFVKLELRKNHDPLQRGRGTDAEYFAARHQTVMISFSFVAT